MTARTRLRSLGACALFVLGTAGFLAPSADAGAPTVRITAPGPDQVMRAKSFFVSAEVSNVGRIRLGLTTEVAGAQTPVNREATASGTARQVVSFDVSLEYNGPYRAEVTADHAGGPLDLNSGTASDSRKFFVAVPPDPPVAVSAVVDPESRGVTLSWKANSEKDMLFYLVQRAKGPKDEAAYSPLGRTDGPGDTSIVDPSTAEAGGDYHYQVVAVRRGPTEKEVVNSNPSPPATANVAAPPGPATTVAGATGGTTPGGTAAGPGTSPSGTTGTTLSPTSPGALRKSGTLDLSGFSSIQSQARRPAIRSNAPDPGFTGTLPFASSNTTRLVDENEQAAAPSDDPEVRELGAEEASNDRQQSAAFLAAGLLATVLLMHLLWVKGEVQREPLEVLVPE